MGQLNLTPGTDFTSANGDVFPVQLKSTPVDARSVESNDHTHKLLPKIIHIERTYSGRWSATVQVEVDHGNVLMGQRRLIIHCEGGK